MKSLSSRFHSKIMADPNSGCWLWTAHVNLGGYGRIGLERSKKTDSAHRISWKLYNGAIPDGLFVLHKCDVPSCVNPDHLFLGTHADNMADMVRKGHTIRCSGKKNGRAKLSDDEVKQIRSLRGEISQREIGLLFGVNDRSVSAIQLGQKWKHVS